MSHDHQALVRVTARHWNEEIVPRIAARTGIEPAQVADFIEFNCDTSVAEPVFFAQVSTGRTPTHHVVRLSPTYILYLTVVSRLLSTYICSAPDSSQIHSMDLVERLRRLVDGYRDGQLKLDSALMQGRTDEPALAIVDHAVPFCASEFFLARFAAIPIVQMKKYFPSESKATDASIKHIQSPEWHALLEAVGSDFNGEVLDVACNIIATSITEELARTPSAITSRSALTLGFGIASVLLFDLVMIDDDPLSASHADLRFIARVKGIQSILNRTTIPLFLRDFKIASDWVWKLREALTK